jgi:hypothetical protein
MMRREQLYQDCLRGIVSVEWLGDSVHTRIMWHAHMQAQKFEQYLEDPLTVQLELWAERHQEMVGLLGQMGRWPGLLGPSRRARSVGESAARAAREEAGPAAAAGRLPVWEGPAGNGVECRAGVFSFPYGVVRVIADFLYFNGRAEGVHQSFGRLVFEGMRMDDMSFWELLCWLHPSEHVVKQGCIEV